MQYLDEQIDVYSYGNNLYAILTGLLVYYDYNDDHEMQDLIKHGKTSYIDERYRTRNFGDAFLTRLIEICWFYRPEDRPTIFDVIELLQQAIKLNDSLLDEGKDMKSGEWMHLLDEIIYVMHA